MKVCEILGAFALSSGVGGAGGISLYILFMLLLTGGLVDSVLYRALHGHCTGIVLALRGHYEAASYGHRTCIVRASYGHRTDKVRALYLGITIAPLC